MAKRAYKLQEFVAHTSDVTCVHIGKKSCRVFVTGGEDRKVNLWAIGKPTVILSLSGHTSSVQSVTFDSAEVLVLGGSSSGMIKLWDLEESKNVRSLTGHRSNCTAVEFHPFGEFFASGSLDTDLKVWDIRKKGCIHTYKGHTRGIKTIKFTPDGRWVVTGGEDNVVKLWDLTAGKLLYDFKCHSGQIRCIDFHPHEFLLATGSADRTVKFWDLETFELIGSVGPEATGVRSMIFHPDGKTLFCGLDERLKVFSWEPIRCHDTVEMGWSTLGDLNIYEGKLLGCSYYQSRVGVWVSDIELIGPYGIMPKTNAVMESVCSHEDYRVVEPTGSSTISMTKSVAGPLDCGSKTKAAVEIPLMISNECCQSIQQDFDRASNTTPMNSSGFRNNSASVNCHSAPPKFDSRFSKKSSVNSSTFRGIKATASRPVAPNGTKSSFASRDVPLRSTVLRANSSLALNKGPMIESITVNNIQALSRSASMPVIIPRDCLEQETASCRKVTAATETSHVTALFKSKHMQNSSLVGGGSESQLISTVSEPFSGMGNDISGTGSNFLSSLAVNGGAVLAEEQKHLNIRNVAERFERIVSVEQPVGLVIDKHDESTSASSESSSVKYVKGVAVQLGRTRSLVESWERRDRCNSSLTSAIGTFSDQVGGAENFSCVQKAQVHTSERDATSGDDSIFPETLLQNHDVFINVVKSRLTKLQVVLHFWEKNGIKGAINAVAKLPDHSVQVDVISILSEKTGLFTLDLFSCLLPVLDGLLISKTERHVTVCLEILLELVKLFGPVIHSTVSKSSSVGVDLQAEQRLERCNQCLNHFVKMKQVLPSLIRSGGLLAKHAQELTLALQGI